MSAQCFATPKVRSWYSLLALLSVVGCATVPSQPARVDEEQPLPDTNVYFYPSPGLGAVSPQRQDRDKYECNAWAVQQTGFDPSLPSVPPHQRVQVVAVGPPPGSGVATGALTGAALGAAVSNPWNAGGNTLIGALVGATIGGIADTERANQADRIEAQASNSAKSAWIEQRAAEYRRAMGACLAGRGYSIPTLS